MVHARRREMDNIFFLFFFSFFPQLILQFIEGSNGFITEGGGGGGGPTFSRGGGGPNHNI